MNAVTNTQVLKIQKFGRFARGACSVLIAFSGVFFAWALFNVIAGPTDDHFKFDLGTGVFTGDQITTVPLKIWLTIVLGVGLVILFSMLWQVRCLFDNLARGQIYVQSNVQHIRRLGWLMLTAACLQIILPVLSFLLMATRVLDLSPAAHNFVISLDVLAPFATAGLLILVSWIMDVGRGVSDEAETLRRDAELVV